jgi:hypothetical protein
VQRMREAGLASFRDVVGRDAAAMAKGTFDL